MSLFNLLSSFGDGIAKLVLFFANFGSIFVAIFKGLFSSILYLLFCGIAIIVNTVETIFKKLVGIDTLYLNGQAYGGASDNSGYDLVYAFITNSAVQNVFWSIVALSLVLLIIFTIVAMIKSEFTLDLKGSAKGPIIARAGKSLVNLLVVPVVTIISILATNFLSKTIYDLFDQTGNTIVQKCWYIGAYNANRARLSEDFANDLVSNKWSWLKDDNAIINGTSPFSGKNSSQIASMVDEYFLDGKLQDLEYNNFSIIDRLTDIVPEKSDMVMWDCVFYAFPNTTKIFSFMEPQSMNLYYNMWQFDYILAIGSAIVIGWMLLGVCLVLLKRVFELTILFLLAPAMTSIAPLDGGQAEKKWRNEFMKRLLAVIGPIFAYNMYFLLIPLFENISLFGGGAYSICMGAGAVSTGGAMLGSMANVFSKYTIIMDIFFQLICIITGMGIIKSASALLSTLLGVDDLVKSGGEAAKKAVDVGKKAALGATAIAGVGFKGAAVLTKGVGNVAKGVGKGVGKAANFVSKSKLGQAVGSGLNNIKEKAKNTGLAKGIGKIGSNVKDTANDIKNSKFGKAVGTAAKGVGSVGKKLFGRKLSKAEQEEMKGYDSSLDDQLDDDGNVVKHGLTSQLSSAREALNTAKEKFDKGEGSQEDYQSALDKYNNAKSQHDAVSAKKKKLVDSQEGLLKRGARFVSSPIRDAWQSEMGEDAQETSIAGKVTHSKLWKSTMGKTLFGRSMAEMLNPESSNVKRRLNDGLAGLFGDGGGGDLWKIWFNKNARAGLYEGVPEAKKRSAAIEQSISWGARDKYYEGKEAKEKRAEEEKMIRRMKAEQEGNKKLIGLYKKLDSGKLSADELTATKAKIKSEEALSGIAQRSRDFYDDMKSDPSKRSQLESYRRKADLDAADKAYKEEKASKEKAAATAVRNGDKPETKISEASIEQLASKLSEKGIKIQQRKGEKPMDVKIDAANIAQAIQDGLTSLQQAVDGLAASLSSENGGKKPDK